MTPKLSPSPFKPNPLNKTSSDYALVVFRFVEAFIAEHGYSPSLREIGKACYISRSTVLRYLDRLEAQGRLTREISTARSISIPKP